MIMRLHVSKKTKPPLTVKPVRLNWRGTHVIYLDGRSVHPTTQESTSVGLWAMCWKWCLSLALMDQDESGSMTIIQTTRFFLGFCFVERWNQTGTFSIHISTECWTITMKNNVEENYWKKVKICGNWQFPQTSEIQIAKVYCQWWRKISDGFSSFMCHLNAILKVTKMQPFLWSVQQLAEFHNALGELYYTYWILC